MADINRFNRLEVRRVIYRHKYVRVCKKYGVLSEYKVCLGLLRAKQLGLKHCKKNLSDCDHHRRPHPPVRYEHDQRFNGYFFDVFPYYSTPV